MEPVHRSCSKKRQLRSLLTGEIDVCADKGHRIQCAVARKAVIMATMHSINPAQHSVAPLHLSGNTTPEQNELLKRSLGEAIEGAYRTAIKQLDKQSAQTVLDSSQTVQREVIDSVVEIIGRHTASDKYKDEQVSSSRIYPATYRVRPVEAQVTELRKLFPRLGECNEKIGRRPLPAGAEAWFAIPRWQGAGIDVQRGRGDAGGGDGNEARKLSNRIIGRLGPTYLRQSERSKLAEKILYDQQQGCDILVVAAQAGMLHRGCSARRTRVAMAGNEFGLGVFAFGSMLLTHPERLSSGETLMVDCGGDDYSVRGDYTFDRVPLFDYDISGIEFSVFYQDRARNLWGTPTGFLYKMS